MRVVKFAWAASERAATLGRADGLTKLVIDPPSGRVVGVGIVEPGAGELIAEAALAVETAVAAEDLAATIHAHPTLAETLMEAAETLLRGGVIRRAHAELVARSVAESYDVVRGGGLKSSRRSSVRVP